MGLRNSCGLGVRSFGVHGGKRICSKSDFDFLSVTGNSRA